MKKALSALLALALVMATPSMALAEHLKGKDGWTVTYTSQGRMVDTYSAAEYVDQVKDVQPGDDITFTVSLSHENDKPADWYVSNDIVTTLEEGANASGSAYEYLLTYEGPGGGRTLYDSTTLGGDDTSGLHEADSALADYIFLGNMSKGQGGTVSLKVTLDGETEQNNYFNTLAQLKINFAAQETEAEPEKPTTPETPKKKTTNRTIVKTGDETRLFPFYVAMVVSGVLFLILAVQSIRLRKEEREEAR